MNSATIVLTIGWLLASGAPHASGVAFVQTAPAQQTSQPDSSAVQNTPTLPSAATPKPCPAVSPSSSTSQPDCHPVSKSKKRRRTQPAAAAPASASVPKKKVVHNGSTTDPPLAISPGVSEQQVSQQVATTNGLLVMTDENLKTIASRQLDAGQQETVEQIKSYMKQSRTAASSGDVQRAYTLANKARMLSGDLVKH